MARKILRIVFFGTADFAVPSLDALIAAGHEILAVVTQPDKPQGRGQMLAASPVKKAAERHGLPIMQPRRVRAESFLMKMRDLAPDALALAAFGQIIPQALLDLPPLGPVNVHGSLLPKYRGAAPIQRAVMAGESETGVTTMWMAAALDTGDMLLAESLPILPNDTSGTLFPRLAEIGARLLVETLDGLAAGTLPRRPQKDAEATLAPAITPEDSAIRWHETAAAIDCRVRGLSPKPGAFAAIKGRRVKIWSIRPHPQPQEQARGADTPVASTHPGLGEGQGEDIPGTVIRISKTPPGLLITAGSGTSALLTEVQPDSGKRMNAADWARGHRLVPGDRFEVVTL